MRRSEFERASDIMLRLTRGDLVLHGAMSESDEEAWSKFRANPCKWLSCADDRGKSGVWAAVEARRPGEYISSWHPRSNVQEQYETAWHAKRALRR